MGPEVLALLEAPKAPGKACKVELPVANSAVIVRAVLPRTARVRTAQRNRGVLHLERVGTLSTTETP